MKDFTLRKRFLDSKRGTSSLFKGFVMLVVLMLMTTSSAMAQEPKFEVIDGFRYLLDSDTKTATLVPKTDGKYSGDIIIPEKVKGNDGVEYVVTSLGCFLLQRLQWLNLYHHPFICYFIGCFLLRMVQWLDLYHHPFICYFIG